MRGLDRLAGMRRNGYRPSLGVIVFVSESVPKYMPQQGEISGDVVILDADESEDCSRADLRALVGLRVMVIGERQEPTTRAAEAISKAGASGVIATQLRHREGRPQQRVIASFNPWTEAEAMTWQD